MILNHPQRAVVIVKVAKTMILIFSTVLKTSKHMRLGKRYWLQRERRGEDYF